jgi:hypothetical protein
MSGSPSLSLNSGQIDINDGRMTTVMGATLVYRATGCDGGRACIKGLAGCNICLIATIVAGLSDVAATDK